MSDNKTTETIEVKLSMYEERERLLLESARLDLENKRHAAYRRESDQAIMDAFNSDNAVLRALEKQRNERYVAHLNEWQAWMTDMADSSSRQASGLHRIADALEKLAQK